MSSSKERLHYLGVTVLLRLGAGELAGAARRIRGRGSEPSRTAGNSKWPLKLKIRS
jgi:hypothetical protein